MSLTKTEDAGFTRGCEAANSVCDLPLQSEKHRLVVVSPCGWWERGGGGVRFSRMLSAERYAGRTSDRWGVRSA
jgi:hypothetical protein